MAYLRLVSSDLDDLAFERIVNVPKRGLGTKSLLDIETFSRKENVSLLESCRKLLQNDHFNTKTSSNLKVFLMSLKSWKEKKRSSICSRIG